MDPVTAEPQAAVAIVCTCLPESSVLLTRRSVREDDPWSGHWSFPGGRREPGDSDLLHTALRELEEECGIRLGRECLQLSLPHVAARRTVGPFILVAPFLLSVCEPLVTRPDPMEVAGTRWIATRFLSDPARHALHAVPNQSERMLFPGVVLENDGMPLWGFTYRLITHWLGLIPETCPCEEAGFQVADSILKHLLARGLKLKQGWIACAPGPTATAATTVQTATVEGAIPVESVRALFTIPQGRIPRVNLLEVRPEYVRVAGLAYEEYVISAVPRSSR